MENRFVQRTPTKEKEEDDNVFTTIPKHILITHIFEKLDGPSVAVASCVSTSLRRICTDQSLWTHLCHATWPSTRTPIVHRFISTYPISGPRSFFSHAFPILVSPAGHHPAPEDLHIQSPPSRLISAIDLHYKNEPRFSTVKVTDTFTRSRFRISVLVREPEGCLSGEDITSDDLDENLRLSWILIDPAARRAVNVSSRRAFAVERRKNGEVELAYPTIMAAGNGKELVQCRPVVRWTEEARRVVGAVEVRMEMEDVDGMKLNGRDSLGILRRAMMNCGGGCERKETGLRREEEGRKRYDDFIKMKRKKKFWDWVDKISVMAPVAVCALFLAFEFFILLYLFIFEGFGTATGVKQSRLPSAPPPFHDLEEMFIYYI